MVSFTWCDYAYLLNVTYVDGNELYWLSWINLLEKKMNIRGMGSNIWYEKESERDVSESMP